MNKILILIVILVLIFSANCRYDVKKYDNDIKVVDFESKFANHGIGYYTALYYKGKKLCSFLGSSTFFLLSPNKRYILYVCGENNPFHYEIYDTIENKKIFFPNMDQIDLFSDDEYHKTTWTDTQVITFAYFYQYTLYIKESILEKKFISKRIKASDYLPEFFEYLIVLLHQFFDNIEKTDKEKLNSFSNVFLDQYPFKRKYGIKKNILSFYELGTVLNKILLEYKNKYGNKLIFHIIERTYKNAFEEVGGKIQFKKDFTW